MYSAVQLLDCEAYLRLACRQNGPHITSGRIEILEVIVLQHFIDAVGQIITLPNDIISKSEFTRLAVEGVGYAACALRGGL